VYLTTLLKKELLVAQPSRTCIASRPRDAAAHAKMGDDDEPQDALLQGLMEQTFGPKDGADRGESVQRGLEEVARLSAARPDFVRRWLHETPSAEAPPAETERLCFRCGAGGAAATCAKCGVAVYCSRECQKVDWGKGGAFGGHKSLCERYKWLGREQRVPPEEHRTMVAELITRTKLYLCPFLVHHAEQGAPSSGFGFVQSECTLAELALPAPRDAWGRPLERPRSLVLMWMSLEEFPEYVAETGDTRAPPPELLAAAASSLCSRVPQLAAAHAATRRSRGRPPSGTGLASGPRAECARRGHVEERLWRRSPVPARSRRARRLFCEPGSNPRRGRVAAAGAHELRDVRRARGARGARAAHLPHPRRRVRWQACAAARPRRPVSSR
jgi:hypothetical protein